MDKTVYYYCFGNQCSGVKYMGEKASELAELLNYKYKTINIEDNSENDLRLFLPGTIIVDGFKITYPGTAEELLESYRRKGPLEGEHIYNIKPLKAPEKFSEINQFLDKAPEICLPGCKGLDVSGKRSWMDNHKRDTHGISGFIAFDGDDAHVAAVEFIREDRCPYPIGVRRENSLFITCIYNSPNEEYDYRASLVEKTAEFARENGYESISIIAGEETPYPNGPVDFLEKAGFNKGQYLDKIFLRYKWENIYFMEYKL